MNAVEKIKRLISTHRQTSVAKAAGIGNVTLNRILRGHTKGRIEARTAFGLARVFGVDPAWLMDDSKGWPPVRVPPAADQVNDPNSSNAKECIHAQ